ncbi:MAG TPA: choice-of-anchor E domain-containing protein [Candidatus Saccharimonadales bacterium]|nr:choice-of-anchor E domain-containing protein [Candidatus Saccharimonadales bacterium]
MKTALLCLAVLAVGLGVASSLPARAATLTYTSTVPMQTTNWSTSLTVPKFNPALGMLMSVSVTVRDSAQHTTQFENLSPSSTSHLWDSTYVQVDVLSPASAPLASALDIFYKTGVFGIYDGVLDYAGTSGGTYPQSAVATGGAVLSAPGDLAAFTGTGSVSLPCSATAWFVVSYSGGNARYVLTTTAAATVTVTYTYNVTTPAPVPTWGKLRRLYH